MQNSSQAMTERALAALRRHAASPSSSDDGMIAASRLALGEIDGPAVSELLGSYLARDRGYGRDNNLRYPWPIITPSIVGDPTYDAGSHGTWWRPMETTLRDRDLRTYARRIALPGLLATQLDLWSRLSHGDGPHAEQVVRLLGEVQPVVENDVVQAIGGWDPWADTLLLWQLSDRGGPRRLVQDLLFALAVRYASTAARDGGRVLGVRHPFHRVPLVSATAHLTLGLWAFGIGPYLLPAQLEFVRGAGDRGAWADGAQPPDVLTTLAAAEVLTRLDPAFDPEPTRAFFASVQEPSGWWRALDPEVPWLTGAIVEWVRRSDRPFGDRFRWPDVAPWQRDFITNLPTMAFFSAVAEAIERISGALGASDVEIAFCDLAGFGDFNTQHGQLAGDRVLHVFGEALQASGLLVVRIGGDEIVVLGKPTVTGALEPALEAFLDGWPDALRTRMGDTGRVRPRIVLDRGPAGTLRDMQGRLGIAIGQLKASVPDVPDRGVLVWRH